MHLSWDGQRNTFCKFWSSQLTFLVAALTYWSPSLPTTCPCINQCVAIAFRILILSVRFTFPQLCSVILCIANYLVNRMAYVWEYSVVSCSTLLETWGWYQKKKKLNSWLLKQYTGAFHCYAKTILMRHIHCHWSNASTTTSVGHHHTSEH